MKRNRATMRRPRSNPSVGDDRQAPAIAAHNSAMRARPAARTTTATVRSAEETRKSVGGDDAMGEVPERVFRWRRQYEFVKSSSAVR